MRTFSSLLTALCTFASAGFAQTIIGDDGSYRLPNPPMGTSIGVKVDLNGMSADKCLTVYVETASGQKRDIKKLSDTSGTLPYIVGPGETLVIDDATVTVVEGVCSRSLDSDSDGAMVDVTF